MSDPTVQQALLDAEYQLKGAEADYANLQGAGEQRADESEVRGSQCPERLRASQAAA